MGIFTFYIKLFCALFFAIQLLIPAHVLKAQEVVADTVIQNNKNQGNEKNKQNSFIQNLADRIDRFFSDKNIEDELQKSSLRFKPAILWEEGGQFDYPLPVQINLVLPRLQNRWQIFFSSVPDEDNDQDPDRIDYTDDQPELDEDKKTTSLIGVQFAPIAGLSQHLKFISGVKIRTNEFNPFGLIRFRYRYDMGTWSMRFVQSTYYYADNGLGETSQIDFGRPLNDATLFRSRSTATWSEQSRGVDLRQSFFLRYLIDEDNILGVYWRSAWHTSPIAIIDGHTIGMEYRRKLGLDWLFWEISPQAAYQRINNFNFVPIVLSSLEIIF